MKNYTITRAKEIDFARDLALMEYNLRAVGEDNMQVSDGFHTMDELYDHRITLFIALCRTIATYWPDQEDMEEAGGNFHIWRSKNHDDGSPAFGGTWFLLGIGKEHGKMITYHLPIERWDETDCAETLEKAPKFDGHTSADVLERLKSL